MKAFFEALGALFTDFLFLPLDLLREVEESSWWGANIFNWIFVIIGMVAFYYWMKQLYHFKETKEDEQDTTAHSFLS